MAKILIVDDDENICRAFRRFLLEQGHTPLVASNARDALEMVSSSGPELVIMDLRMPGTDGLTALRALREMDPGIHVVIMTAYGTSQTSIEAVRLGAFDYLTKPLDLDVVGPVIDKALEARALARQLRLPHDEEGERFALVDLRGSSAPMQEVYKRIGLVTTNDVPVLLVGERGAGKNLVARTIHFNSHRRERPLLSVDCRAMPEPLLERELFGRAGPPAAAEPGGAAPGKLETARGGTVLLENVDALSLPLQARILRVLHERVMERPGGSAPVGVDVRILAATEKDLAEEVRHGSFHPELHDGLRIVSIELPPLRERRGDIAELVSHFIQRCNAELGSQVRGIDARVERLFRGHPWPGNVGELENSIKRACVRARGEVITPDDLGDSLQGSGFARPEEADSALRRAVRRALQERIGDPEAGAGGSSFHELVGLVEEVLVREALVLTSGNQLRAAELLGVNRTTLRKKMRLYGLGRP